MKVSGMIKNLQDFMEENGDIDCYYAVDDEGNDYKEVYYKPTLMLENSYGDLYSVKEIEEDDSLDEDERAEFKKVCIVN
jgi:hypothetical protein